jgi:hypothetical protein
MHTRYLSLTIRALLGVFALLAGVFVSFGSAFAEERKPEPRLLQVAEETSDATAPIHVATTDANGQPCTFDALFAVMSNTSIRAVFTNVAGGCDGVRATGEVSADGYPTIVVDEQVRPAEYPGIKLGAFPDLPYDTANVTFKITIGAVELPTITLQHKHGPVHVWLNFPQWPNKCVVDGTFVNDPGFVITDNGRELKRAWFSAESGAWGPVELTGNGDHNLKIETYKPRDGKEQWDEVNQVLTASFQASCDKVDPPLFEARPTVDCQQNWHFDIIKQERVASVEWSVNGKRVADLTNGTPAGNLGAEQSIRVQALVVGADGKTYTYDYTVERKTDGCTNPEPPTFIAKPTIDCAQDWSVAVTESKNVASVRWFVDGQPVAEPKGNLGAATSLAVRAEVLGADDQTYTYDYTVERNTDPCPPPPPPEKLFSAVPSGGCDTFQVAIDKQKNVASVAWSVNGAPADKPVGSFGKAKSVVVRANVTYADGTGEAFEYTIARKTDCGRTRLRLQSSNQVECAALPYSDQRGLIKYKTFDHVSVDNGDGDWRLLYGEFSLDGHNWTRFEGKLFGFDPRAGEIKNPVWINWTVGLYVNGVSTGETKTIGDSLPGFDPADEATWRTFDAVLDWASARFLQAGKPDAIDSIRASIAGCTPPPPPPVTLCIQGPNGPAVVTFADGKIPAGVQVLESCDGGEVEKQTVCTGWDIEAKRGIFTAFTADEQAAYEQAAKEEANRCRPPEAAGQAPTSQGSHAHLHVRGIDANVTWLDAGSDFPTNMAAEHRWNSKRIVSLHYFGKGRALERVQTGDEISWIEGGNVARYRVTMVKVVAFNGAEYGDPESLVPDNGIMLMTCYRPKSATAIGHTLMVVGERIR